LTKRSAKLRKSLFDKLIAVILFLIFFFR